MQYLLVIQFPDELFGDLDWFVEMEDKFIDRISGIEVDGHDMGDGEANIFIVTDNPIHAFEEVKIILEEEDGFVIENAKIAYRALSGEEYICLWPKDLNTFDVL